jgi:5'-3' exonuclease
MPTKSLIIDISNILFRVAAVQKHKKPYARDSSPEDLVGLCFHISLHSIYKWYEKYKPDFVVFAFEGDYGKGPDSGNWRKTFTAAARSRKAYKGNRVVDPAMAHYYDLIAAFKKTIHAHTSICCLSVDTMEADDVIAGYCQLYASPEHTIHIVSGDRDYIQLTKLPNVHLVNPDNGKFRNQPGDKDYEPDIDYWLFYKCVRGDMGDYVPAAYPKVRETRIRKAYNESYERLNFMNETWTDENGTVHRVGDLYEENVKLLSLYDQPQKQRDILLEGVKQQVSQINQYSHFHFLRFLEQYQLNAIRRDSTKFAGLFANNQLFVKGLKKPDQVIAKQEETQTTPITSTLIEF